MPEMSRGRQSRPTLVWDAHNNESAQRSNGTVMDETRGSQGKRSAPRKRLRWHWQAGLAALLALLAVEGQPVAASYATGTPAGRAIHGARVAPSAATADGAANVSAGREAPAARVAGRPDFSVQFAHLDDAQPGQPFSYTIQVRNAGDAGGTVSVSTVLPPDLSNVRVTAPGFVCTRHFAASGPQAGTQVACTRGDLEGGAVADVTVEANAPAGPGPIHLTARADPRGEIAEADETNNDADVTVEIQA
jgi:uncharacterized repeat protein (TIGR01451 family)